MERRTLLKTVGGIGAASATGGVGLAALSGSAMAASSDLSISNAGTVSTDDGDLSEVIVQLDHTVDWDGFDVGVDAISYTDSISVVDGGGNNYGSAQIHDSGPVSVQEIADGNYGGPGENATIRAVDEDDSSSGANALSAEVNADILWTVAKDSGAPTTRDSVQTPAIFGKDIQDLDVGSDNSSKTYTVTYEKVITFYTEGTEGNYNELTAEGTVQSVTASGDFTVTVENEEATSSSSGSGGSNAN